MTQSFILAPELIAEHNRSREARLKSATDAVSEELEQRGVDAGEVIDRLAALSLALPSWGAATGGTRFARFTMPGEARSVEEKLDDCSVVQQLTRVTPTVSLHFPWDHVSDPSALRAHAEARGLRFDAVNSNTFQDQRGQALSYKFGSLSHTDERVRGQAIEHNLHCIELAVEVGSKALTVWVADGSNFPGQQDFSDAFERYLASMRAIYAALPADFSLYVEHKLYEPAFYSTVVQDWGTSYLAASALGPQASCLVDLGHHAPNVNIEMIVARLASVGKLGGFHFNDSKYGDDDLDSGSIKPFQLFLIWHELVSARKRWGSAFAPLYMLDQSHNVTDPLESLMESASSIAAAYARALCVDRVRLREYQEHNDALMAARTLRDAFETDVRPLVRTARARAGAAIDPVRAYRESGYRARIADQRPQPLRTGGGIV